MIITIETEDGIKSGRTINDKALLKNVDITFKELVCESVIDMLASLGEKN